MKVVQVVGSLETGGAERVALEVAAGMMARGRDSEILSLSPVYESQALAQEARRRGVRVRSLTLGSIRSRRARARVLDYLRRERPALHVHNRPGDWQIVGLARVAGRPALYTRHLPYASVTSQQRLRYLTAARMARAVVAVSAPVWRHLLRVEHAPERKLRLIQNGIDTDRFTPAKPDERAAVRRELGIAPGDFLWMCSARLARQKGHADLLRALAARPPGSRSRVCLAGDGPREAELRRLAARLSLEGCVHFLGARRDVARLLGAADGYVCSSHSEGHPLALLEALSVGIPVVAPRLPSVTSLGADWAIHTFGPEHGDWAPAHDPAQLAQAMGEVESAPPDADLARRRRRWAVDVFSLDRMIDRHEALYDEVMR